MEVGQRRLGLAASQRDAALQMPRFGRPRREPHRLTGQPLRLVEQSQFQMHLAAVDAQRGIIGGQLQRLGDLADGLHLQPPFPEHVGIVLAGVDVDGTPLHRLLEEPLRPQQIAAVGRRQTLVAEAAGIGHLRSHGIAALHEPAPRPTGHDERREAEDRHDDGAETGHGDTGGRRRTVAAPGVGEQGVGGRRPLPRPPRLPGPPAFRTP